MSKTRMYAAIGLVFMIVGTAVPADAATHKVVKKKVVKKKVPYERTICVTHCPLINPKTAPGTH